MANTIVRLKRSSTRGFTLIELLVSMVVVMLGSLGLASTQVLVIKNANNTSTRALAMLYMQSTTEMMRANRANADHYLSSSVASINCGSPTAIHEQDLCQWKNWVESLSNGNGSISKSGDVYSIHLSFDEQTMYNTSSKFALQTTVEF